MYRWKTLRSPAGKRICSMEWWNLASNPEKLYPTKVNYMHRTECWQKPSYLECGLVDNLILVQQDMGIIWWTFYLTTYSLNNTLFFLSFFPPENSRYCWVGVHKLFGFNEINDRLCQPTLIYCMLTANQEKVEVEKQRAQHHLVLTIRTYKFRYALSEAPINCTSPSGVKFLPTFPFKWRIEAQKE